MKIKQIKETINQQNNSIPNVTFLGSGAKNLLCGF